MKLRQIPKKIGVLAAALSMAVCLLCDLPLTAGAQSSYNGKELNIIFTHDTHSHIDDFVTVEKGQGTVAGGFARIKTIINQALDKDPDTLIIDAGDFSMGTLVQTIFDKKSPELRMLGDLGCEVTTLGNHEFDYRSQGLADAMNIARESGDPLPAMVLANIDWETMEAEGLTEEQKLLKDTFEAYGMQDYVILQKGDVKVAVFGVFGQDSLECAPTCVLKFKDISEAATEVVGRIKTHEDADIIVCVSHSGTNDDPKKSEDEILAAKVPEIDFIVSGHTHTTLAEPIIVKNKQGRHTIVASCGEYGKNVGSISLKQDAQGRWNTADYELIPITPAIPADEATQEKVNSFLTSIDSDYLAQFGYTRLQVVAQNDVVFSTSPDCYTIHTDHNLGHILSDSFRYAVNSADTGDDHPVDAAIAPSGCIRDTFAVGDITVQDVFNSYSLGIGLDGIAGYPLLSFYLTGAELKTGAEIDASLSDIMDTARLFISGMDFTFNPHRMILNKVTEVYHVDENGNRTEFEDNTLYRVVCDLYSGQMLGAVTDVSFGILQIQPKFKDGTPITNIEDAIIHDADGREIKAWASIAQYMESLPDADGDGIANIPASYATDLTRKVVDDSMSPASLLKNPNKYFFIIIGILLAVVLLVILIIRLLVKLIRRLTRPKYVSDPIDPDFLTNK